MDVPQGSPHKSDFSEFDLKIFGKKKKRLQFDIVANVEMENVITSRMDNGRAKLTKIWDMSKAQEVSMTLYRPGHFGVIQCTCLKIA